MAKLIQKSGFLSKKRAGRYMKYIATRDGVEILNEDAEGIYMRYIATRPRAEKHEGHGLFGAEPHVDLEKTMQELKTHEGKVWTIIYSLRREDAARLGYSPAAAVFAAKAEGLCTAGIVDHDTTAGAEEFIEAGKIADMPVTVGMETRVSMVCTAGSPTPRQKRFRLAANGSAIATAWFLKVRLSLIHISEPTRH